MFLGRANARDTNPGTQNECCVSMLRKLGNIMLRARANVETFVSATMCPRLPGPLVGASSMLWMGQWMSESVREANQISCCKGKW